MSDFQQYQSFAAREVAQPLLDLLEKQGIPFETSIDEPSFSINFAYNATDTRFVVRLRPGDFEAARQLEDQNNQQLITDVASDHYLLTFSDEELFEIVAKPDEWSSYDVTLAGKLLQQRGRDVSPDALRLLRQHRIAELAQPEPSLKTWIVAGYVFAALGGLMGIFIGWHLHYHKKALPDGRQVFAHSLADRRHGFRILVLGVVGFIIGLGLKLIPSN